MSTIRFVLGAVVTALTLTTTTARVAVSQPLRRFVVTPYVGVYVPTADVGRTTVANGGRSGSLSLRQRTTLALGGTASYWLDDRWAIEVGTAYSASDVKSTVSPSIGEGNFSADDREHASLWFSAVKAMVNLTPATSDVRLRFGFGPALISRSGNAYRSDAEGSVTGTTSYGGAFSLCTRIPLAGAFGLRLRVEDYVYRAKLGFRGEVDPAGSFRLGARTQHDFVLSVGVEVGVVR